MISCAMIVQLSDLRKSLSADGAEMWQVFLLELIILVVLRLHDAMTLSHVTIQAFLPCVLHRAVLTLVRSFHVNWSLTLHNVCGILQFSKVQAGTLILLCLLYLGSCNWYAKGEFGVRPLCFFNSNMVWLSQLLLRYVSLARLHLRAFRIYSCFNT